MSSEQGHLKLADEHIRQAKERIAGQEALIQDLAARGHDTRMAESLLRTFVEALSAMRDHRGLIIDELDREARKAAE